MSMEICKRLSDNEMIDAIELNISCPNVDQGGMALVLIQLWLLV